MWDVPKYLSTHAPQHCKKQREKRSGLYLAYGGGAEKGVTGGVRGVISGVRQRQRGREGGEPVRSYHSRFFTNKFTCMFHSLQCIHRGSCTEIG